MLKGSFSSTGLQVGLDLALLNRTWNGTWQNMSDLLQVCATLVTILPKHE